MTKESTTPVNITREHMIELLNEDLAGEYQAIIAYTVNSSKFAGDSDTAPVGLGCGYYVGGVRPPARACRRARVAARAIPFR
jgi:hypothetical protein